MRSDFREFALRQLLSEMLILDLRAIHRRAQVGLEGDHDVTEALGSYDP